MEFPYVKFEGERGPIFRPCVPVTFHFEKGAFTIGSALVDTGADMTVLPMDIAQSFDVGLSETDGVRIKSAGGGAFVAVRSKERIDQSIEVQGFRPCRWSGHVYFAPRQSIALLGHEECLEYLNLLFKGPQRRLVIQSRG